MDGLPGGGRDQRPGATGSHRQPLMQDIRHARRIRQLGIARQIAQPPYDRQADVVEVLDLAADRPVIQLGCQVVTDFGNATCGIQLDLDPGGLEIAVRPLSRLAIHLDHGGQRGRGNRTGKPQPDKPTGLHRKSPSLEPQNGKIPPQHLQQREGP